LQQVRQNLSFLAHFYLFVAVARSQDQGMSSATLASRYPYTPPDVARRYAVAIEKVYGWIATGQLRAINVASSLSLRRPRWRISEADLAEFEARRTAAQPVPTKPRPRRKKEDGLINFF
jgi:hypothetical protein